MGEKKLVVLDNNNKFVLIKEFNEPEGKFYFAAGVTDDEEDLTGLFLYFKEVIKDGARHLEEVTDKSIVSRLTVDESDFE